MRGHSKHRGHSRHEAMLESFRRRLIVSIVLTIPILLFSRGFQAIVGFTTPRSPGLDAVLMTLSDIIVAVNALTLRRFKG